MLGLECPPLYNTVPRLEDSHHHLVVKIKNNYLCTLAMPTRSVSVQALTSRMIGVKTQIECKHL